MEMMPEAKAADDGTLQDVLAADMPQAVWQKVLQLSQDIESIAKRNLQQTLPPQEECKKVIEKSDQLLQSVMCIFPDWTAALGVVVAPESRNHSMMIKSSPSSALGYSAPPPPAKSNLQSSASSQFKQELNGFKQKKKSVHRDFYGSYTGVVTSKTTTESKQTYPLCRNRDPNRNLRPKEMSADGADVTRLQSGERDQTISSYATPAVFSID